jgi:hypothetical protein
MLGVNQASDTDAGIAVQPTVDGIWVTGAQQAMARHSVRGVSIGDFQNSGTAFAHVWAGVMITPVDELLTLLVCKFNHSTASHTHLRGISAFAR